jgi:helicase
LQKFIKTLSLRVKHGVKEELLKLCALQNIGRVRARSLYEHGVKGYTDIKHVDIRKLSAIPQIGSKIAHSLKEQVKKLGV